MEILRGLGKMYDDDPAFHANQAVMHTDLPAFFMQAIRIYAANLKNEMKNIEK